MTKSKITKLTQEQFKKCSYVESIDTIYNRDFGDGRKTPYSVSTKYFYVDGKVIVETENGHRGVVFDTRSINGATKRMNDDINYYGNNDGGMPNFKSEYYIVYNNTLKARKTTRRIRRA